MAAVPCLVPLCTVPIYSVEATVTPSWPPPCSESRRKTTVRARVKQNKLKGKRKLGRIYGENPVHTASVLLGLGLAAVTCVISVVPSRKTNRFIRKNRSDWLNLSYGKIRRLARIFWQLLWKSRYLSGYSPRSIDELKIQAYEE